MLVMWQIMFYAIVKKLLKKARNCCCYRYNESSLSCELLHLCGIYNFSMENRWYGNICCDSQKIFVENWTSYWTDVYKIFVSNLLTLNKNKTKFMHFHSPTVWNRISVLIDGHAIEKVDKFVYLGLCLDTNLNFVSYIDTKG